MYWRLIVLILECEREASFVDPRPHKSHFFAILVLIEFIYILISFSRGSINFPTTARLFESSLDYKIDSNMISCKMQDVVSLSRKQKTRKQKNKGK